MPFRCLGDTLQRLHLIFIMFSTWRTLSFISPFHREEPKGGVNMMRFYHLVISLSSPLVKKLWTQLACSGNWKRLKNSNWNPMILKILYICCGNGNWANPTGKSISSNQRRVNRAGKARAIIDMYQQERIYGNSFISSTNLYLTSRDIVMEFQYLLSALNG